jgi:hypothetical protein
VKVVPFMSTVYGELRDVRLFQFGASDARLKFPVVQLTKGFAEELLQTFEVPEGQLAPELRNEL